MWLVMNIGCIECGVGSEIVGIFEDKNKADAIAALCNKELEWRQGGQNVFEVFELPDAEQVAEEYKETVSRLKYE